MILLRRYLTSFFLVGGIFIGGLSLGNNLIDSAIANNSDPYSSMIDIARTLHIIENNYIEEVETSNLVRFAISARSLSRISLYFYRFRVLFTSS